MHVGAARLRLLAVYTLVNKIACHGQHKAKANGKDSSSTTLLSLPLIMLVFVIGRLTSEAFFQPEKFFNSV